MALFEDLRRLGNAPRLVQTSSIGVFGLPLPARIDDRTQPAPTLTYGAHKLMMETLLADYSRRGWIDGRSVRLPSVVARPAGPNGGGGGAPVKKCLLLVRQRPDPRAVRGTPV